MAAPKKNQFWRRRSSHGRKPIFKDPEVLEKACYEWFDWVERSPLYEHRPFAYQGSVKIKKVPKMRAMTLSGLCLFLDIGEDSWRNYRAREGFIEVCERIERIMYTQKFEGAAGGELNPAIIARDLGLKEQVDTEVKIYDFTKMSDEDLKSELNNGDD